jgi:hypothetical protein
MRALILTLALIAVPALAVAQQADVQGDLATPKVHLETTTPATPAPAADLADTEGADYAPVTVESSSAADDAAAQAGDPTTARWWWLVGAIVVGGILLAVLL